MKFVKILASAAIAAAAILTSPPAVAVPVGQGCVEDFWMWGLRSANRTICDGERQADGSWRRVRGFFDDAYWTRPRTSCSGGTWSSVCTYYEKELVPALEVIDPAYIVTDDDRRFQAIAHRLPDGVEPVRLYESYLTNFSFTNGE